MANDRTLIVLSGAVCAGKSTLARGLAASREGLTLTTRALIAGQLGADPDQIERALLQKEGDRLDAETGGEWIAAATAELLEGAPAGLVVVDAVRKEPQLDALAALAPLLHVHLSASENDLERRYRARQLAAPQLEFPSLADLRVNATEAAVERLGAKADLVIDTSAADAEETRAEVVALVEGEENAA